MFKPVLATIPRTAEVHSRLGQALREVTLLRSLLRVARQADTIRATIPPDDRASEEALAEPPVPSAEAGAR
jgi:hypothetical protein